MATGNHGKGGKLFGMYDKHDLITKLINIGQSMFGDPDVPIKAIAEYVTACQREFNLTDDDVSTITYQIVRMK